jgi:hypothetical protein
LNIAKRWMRKHSKWRDLVRRKRRSLDPHEDQDHPEGDQKDGAPSIAFTHLQKRLEVKRRHKMWHD